MNALRRARLDATSPTRPDAAPAMPVPDPADSAPYTFDAATRSVRVDGRSVRLTPKDYDLLAHLFAHPGAVLSREQLLADVWGMPAALATRTVDSHVSRLRRALDLGSGVRGWRIVAVQGRGYRLDRTRE
jgi:DNA-binding response OmpR family regulator